METLKIGSTLCRVVRSKRRTVAMRGSDDGVPEILAPQRVSLRELVRICTPYEARLVEMARKSLEIASARQAFTLGYGSRVRFLGGEREVRAGARGRVGYDDEAFYIPPMLDAPDIRDAVVAVYKLAAKNYIPERVSTISQKMGLTPSAVKINSAKSHWATCSHLSSLNFTWYCIMAHPEAIDYIIIHELCHMRHFNHSPEFWAEVEKYCPDYKTHKSHLRSLWREISREGWQ